MRDRAAEKKWKMYETHNRQRRNVITHQLKNTANIIVIKRSTTINQLFLLLL